jgi:hypothetical protein
MEKLFLIIPFFGYDPVQVNVMKWIKDDKTRERFLKMGFNPPQIHALNINEKIDDGVQIVDRVPKGKAIRLLLAARRTDKVDYIVCIDGDGQIPFDNIFEMCFQLKNRPVEAILSCRKGHLGVSEDRAIIEQFELYLLGQLYGCRLPDGQCGFWGFKGELLDRVNLTADGFEIELDLLAECLDAKPRVLFGFIETEVKEGEKTTFDIMDNKRKLIFVSSKLRIGIDLVRSLANKYEESTERALPEDYKSVLSSLSEKEVPLVYPICYDGSCLDCRHRLN